ncbi:MAG: DUF2993 domain-containing protein [Xenococcaceae cyanobacterium]
MEFLTILLSSLLAIVSPAGLILDSAIENAFRSQFEEVEQLEIRIDNAPSYQILQGKVERIRIASRGVQLIPNLRIEALELETDPIDVDLQHLRQGGRSAFNESLRQPVQGGVRLVLTEADINRALQSPEIQSRLEQLVNRFLPGSAGSQTRRYELFNPRVELLGDNRLRVQVQLRKSGSQGQASQPLDIMLELGLKVVAGRSFQLIEPVATINGRRVSTRLLKGVARGLTSRLDLRRLEETGITARLLQLDIERNEVNVVGFVRVEGSLKLDN